jgi:hypothetical protein
MAIKLPLIWRGINIPEAYVRIDKIQGGKHENRTAPSEPGEALWQATVGVYGDSLQPVPAITLNLNVPIVMGECAFTTIYRALKAAPDFSAGTDC